MVVYHRVFEIVTAAAAILGLFLALVLLGSGRGNRRANRCLAFLLAVFSIIIFHSSYFPLYLMKVFNIRRDMNEPFLFLVGPCIYIYMREMVYRKGVSLRDILHLLPLIIFFALWLPALMLERHYILFEWLKLNSLVVSFVVWCATLVQLGFYVHAVVVMTGIHDKRNENSYSTTGKMSLSWVGNFLMLMVSVFVLLLLGLLLRIINVPGVHFTRAVIILFAAIIYIMGYRGLLQPDLLSAEGPSPGEKPSPSTDIKSRLDTGEIDLIEKQIRTLMEDDKPWLDADFSLDMMSAATGVHRNHLSFVINSRFGCNFFNFVNGYRVDEVKRLMAAAGGPGNILTIAFDSGFNSKASFNSIFKKFTGVTPSLYRKSLRDRISVIPEG